MLPRPVPNVFISYRREDSAASAGRLVDRFSEALGAEHVFRDGAVGAGTSTHRPSARFAWHSSISAVSFLGVASNSANSAGVWG